LFGENGKYKESFAEGKKMFQEGTYEPEVKNPIWVKKNVSRKEWDKRYSHDNSYCPISITESNVWVGFCVVGNVPVECFEICDIEELRSIDYYRRANRVYPLPLLKVEV